MWLHVAKGGWGTSASSSLFVNGGSNGQAHVRGRRCVQLPLPPLQLPPLQVVAASHGLVGVLPCLLLLLCSCGKGFSLWAPQSPSHTPLSWSPTFQPRLLCSLCALIVTIPAPSATHPLSHLCQGLDLESKEVHDTAHQACCLGRHPAAHPGAGRRRSQRQASNQQQQQQQ